MRQMRSRFHSTPMMSIDPPKQHFIHCSGGHDLSEKLACACLRRSNGTSLSFGGLDVVLVPVRRRKAALHMMELRSCGEALTPLGLQQSREIILWTRATLSTRQKQRK